MKNKKLFFILSLLLPLSFTIPVKEKKTGFPSDASKGLFSDFYFSCGRMPDEIDRDNPSGFSRASSLKP